MKGKCLPVMFFVFLFSHIAFAQSTNKMAAPAMTVAGLAMTVSASQTVNVKGGLTINPGAEIINKGTLKVHGTWENNGTFAERTGIVILTGSGDCINGETSFNNLEIDVSGTTDIGTGLGKQTIWNTLTLTDGIFDVRGDSLVLISDALGTARVGPLPGAGSMTGDFTMQRFIGPAVTDGWRLLSSPVYKANIEGWNDDFLMSGFPGTDAPGSPFTSLWYYDETDLGILDLGWVAPGSTFDFMPTGRGYMAWVGEQAGDPISITVDITDSLTSGTQAISVTYTDGPQDDTHDGWNLIGNPYPSDVLWDDVALSGTLTPFAYFYNPGTKAYDSYNQGDVYTIPSHQGFWVKVAIGGSGFETVTFDEVDKTTDGSNFLKMGNSEKIAMTLTGYGSYNKADIRFNAAATADYDWQYDAFKLPTLNSNYVNLSTISSDNLELQINSIPTDYMNFNVPIKIYWGDTEPADPTQSLSLIIDSLPSALPSVCLEDLITGNTIELYEGMQYDFSASYSPSPLPRFILHGLASSCITSSVALHDLIEEQIVIKKTKKDIIIDLNLLSESLVKIKILNVLGQRIFEESLTAKSRQVVINRPFETAGTFFVSVATDKTNKVVKVLTGE